MDLILEQCEDDPNKSHSLPFHKHSISWVNVNSKYRSRCNCIKKEISNNWLYYSSNLMKSEEWHKPVKIDSTKIWQYRSYCKQINSSMFQFLSLLTTTDLKVLITVGFASISFCFLGWIGNRMYFLSKIVLGKMKTNRIKIKICLFPFWESKETQF